MANKYTATPTPDKALLEQHYFNEYKSQSEVGDAFGVSQKVVYSWFKKLGIKSRKPYKRNQRGEKNHMWKGDNASYAAMHYRVKSARGKASRCEECGRSDNGISYDWANISEDYGNINDYKEMCRSCHFKMDSHRNNLPNHPTEKNINKRKQYDERQKHFCQRGG